MGGKEPKSEGDSQIIWGNNFPIVDLNPREKRQSLSESIKSLKKIAGDKKATEDTIKIHGLYS